MWAEDGIGVAWSPYLISLSLCFPLLPLSLLSCKLLTRQGQYTLPGTSFVWILVVQAAFHLSALKAPWQLQQTHRRQAEKPCMVICVGKRVGICEQWEPLALVPWKFHVNPRWIQQVSRGQLLYIHALKLQICHLTGWITMDDLGQVLHPG